VRSANALGAFSHVRRVGDSERGDVLIISHTQNTRFRLFGRAFTFDDSVKFEKILIQEASLSEVDLEDYLSRRIQQDPDLWVVEVDDKLGRHFITEPIINENAAKKNADKYFR
jgi:hypothetical protein